MLWAVEDLVHCTAHNYRLRFCFQQYLLLVVTIPGILIQQQSRIVQSCFIKLSEPWTSEPQSLCLASLTHNQVCTCPAHKQWWSRESNRLPSLPAASAVWFPANCTAHTWQCSDLVPGAAGAAPQSCRSRDWGDSVGMMWCWLHTLARHCCCWFGLSVVLRVC